MGLDQPGAVALARFPDRRQVSGLPKEQIQPLIQQSVEPLQKAPPLFGKAMPNGIIPYFGQDVSITLDQLTALNKADPNNILTGRLDLQHMGAFGISLGGMNVAEACLKDSRLKACLITDVYMPDDVVKAGPQQPSMFITRDADTMRLERKRAGGWTGKDILQTLTTMRAVYESLPGDGYYVQIPKMFHLNLTDFPYWSPITSQIGMTGPIDSQRTFDIINAYSVAFFDKHLKSQPSPPLNRPSKQYPEVLIDTRQHSSVASLNKALISGAEVHKRPFYEFYLIAPLGLPAARSLPDSAKAVQPGSWRFPSSVVELSQPGLQTETSCQW